MTNNMLPAAKTTQQQIVVKHTTLSAYHLIYKFIKSELKY